MPSTDDQLTTFAAQSFGPSYRIAVTSWMTDAKFELRFQNTGNTPHWDRHVENLVSLQQAGSADWLVTDSSFIPQTKVVTSGVHYNQQSSASRIERVLAARLDKALGVKPTFFDRRQIEDPESRFESPMHSAKAKAAATGYDALAMIYFEPRLRVHADDVISQDSDAQFVSLEGTSLHSDVRSDDAATYAMAYDTHIVLRALKPDALMYSRMATYTCGSGDENYTLPSGIAVQRQQRKTFTQCEVEIIDQAIADLEAELNARD